jgi:AraC-like DNA-binding protein/TolB-like protein
MYFIPNSCFFDLIFLYLLSHNPLSISIMNLTLASDKEFVEKLTRIILDYLDDEKFGVEELITHSGLGRNVLRHRLKMLTKKTMSQFISEVRLNKARELLQQGSLTVSEVSWKTGFGSPEYFIRCFHDFYGYPPGEAKKRIQIKEVSKESQNDTLNMPTNILDSWYKSPVLKKNLYVSLGLILFVMFGYLCYFIFSRSSLKSIPKNNEINIAILPFKNDSPDTNNVFFFNHLAEEISEKLTETGTYAVTPRRSVERYRNNTTLTSRQIAKELKVDYLVDGSGQKVGNSVSLTVHIINSLTDKNAFSILLEDRNNNELVLCAAMANEITSQIIDEVHIEGKTKIGNPKSDKEIAAILLGNALKLRSHGDLYREQRVHNDSLAEWVVNQSLQYDSTNADAYNLLSNIYLSRNKIDTATFLNEKALQIDKNNAGAYNIKAKLLEDNQFLEKKKLWEKSIKLDPDYPTPYSFLGNLYWAHGELANGLIFKYKALKKLGTLGSDPPEAQMQKYDNFTYIFCDYLINFGYFTTAKKFADERIKLFREYSAGHVLSMLNGYLLSGRGREAYNFGLKNKFPDYVHYNLLMGYVLMHLREYDTALVYLKRGVELSKKGDNCPWNFMVAFALIQTGRKVEGDKMLDMSVINCAERLNNPANKELLNFMDNYRFNPYISLASVYAVKGQKEKALEYMAMDRKTHPSLDLTGLKFLEEFPMLDNIRNEPEYKEYFVEAQRNFLIEKKKVERFLLRENITLEE